MAQILAHPQGVRASKTPPSALKSVILGAEKSRESLRDVSFTASSSLASAVDVGGSAPLGTSCEIAVQKGGSGIGKRMLLQTTARVMLEGAPHPKSDKGYRIAHCQRSRIKDGKVKFMTGPTGKAKFAGLQSCGSVWCCAVCSHKVSRLREQEIAKGMNTHFAAGGGSVMVTYTHSHRAQDALQPMLVKFAEATKAMTGWRAYKDLLIQFCYEGRIRAQEITFGFEHGWHNHTHEGWLLTKHLTEDQALELQNALFPIWKKACKKFGLPAPSKAHGVDVRIAYSPQEYLAKFSRDQKWGTGAELAKSGQKKSEGRYTPFDFLRAFQAGDRAADMERLFREFAFATFNGRQIRWSNGLKRRLGIAEKTDEELAAEVEQRHIEGGTLSNEEWRKVIDRPQDVRSTVLRTFETGGMDAVRKYIENLDHYSSHRVAGRRRGWTNLHTGEVFG